MVYWDCHNHRYVGRTYKFNQLYEVLVITVDISVADKAWADLKVSTQDLKVHVNDNELFEVYLT